VQPPHYLLRISRFFIVVRAHCSCGYKTGWYLNVGRAVNVLINKHQVKAADPEKK
jgi:hypothetical protein